MTITCQSCWQLWNNFFLFLQLVLRLQIFFGGLIRFNKICSPKQVTQQVTIDHRYRRITHTNLLDNSRPNGNLQVLRAGKSQKIFEFYKRGNRQDFDYLYRANYQRCCGWVAVAHKWDHASIPHASMYFVCYRLPCNATATPSLYKKHLTGALFKRQRIDGNLWQWPAGHSWVSISPLSLWTPGSAAAKHNAPLSPPAFAPVPRGEMDKGEIEGEKWEEEVMAVEEVESIMFNPSSHSRKRGFFWQWFMLCPVADR